MKLDEVLKLIESAQSGDILITENSEEVLITIPKHFQHIHLKATLDQLILIINRLDIATVSDMLGRTVTTVKKYIQRRNLPEDKDLHLQIQRIWLAVSPNSPALSSSVGSLYRTVLSQLKELNMKKDLLIATMSLTCNLETSSVENYIATGKLPLKHRTPKLAVELYKIKYSLSHLLNYSRCLTESIKKVESLEDQETIYEVEFQRQQSGPLDDFTS